MNRSSLNRSTLPTWSVQRKKGDSGRGRASQWGRDTLGDVAGFVLSGLVFIGAWTHGGRGEMEIQM